MLALRAVLALYLCLPSSVWSVEQFKVRVADQKPLVRDNFVQGVEILNGHLYLSSGGYGASRLVRYRFKDMQEDISRTLATEIFAEGLTILGDNLYQLTWKNRAMLVYRVSDLAFQGGLPLAGEGWGLTHNNTELIYSDGSDKLHFMTPATGKILRSITVTEAGQPVTQLNELEVINGAIWANIWQRNRIVIIDPASGEVTGAIDLQGLLPPSEYRPDTDVLNGIARNPTDGSIWVTGKRWPWMYRIELVPTAQTSESQQTDAKSR